MKKQFRTWVAVIALGGALGADLAMAEPAATQPAAGTPAAATRPARRPGRRKGALVKPYSDMKTLTPQQQDQILKIHEDVLDQEAKIREKEKDDIAALLTPEQQTELNDVLGKEKDDRKTTAGTRRKRGEPTTLPTK